MKFGSDVVVDLLQELGVEHAALTPGATFRGLHDSLVNYGEGGIRLIECLHEEDSVALAHGYAKAAGRPMVAALHDIVGLQHAAMAIYNAWCDRAPVILIGATGPMDAAKRRPWIDWIHTANAQASQVRDYTKWDDQPASLDALPESILRAHRICTSAPAGPVYVCLDAELQERPVPEGFLAPLPEVAPPTPLSPHPPAVQRLARWLVEAERPAILADRVGREDRALRKLVELAELLSLPVIDRERSYNKVALNFPTRHPLNLSGDAEEVLGASDLVVGLDTLDLFGSLHEVDPRGPSVSPRVPTTARKVLVGVDHLAARGWSADVQRLAPTDLHVAAEPEPLLDALLPCVRAALAGAPEAAERIEARRRRLAERSEATRARWRREAVRAQPRAPGRLARPLVARILDELTAGHDRVLANGTLGHWALRLWDLERAHQYCGGSGGAGLGYGLPASIGVALAHAGSGRLVIDLQSDGDALATPQALWIAAHERIPLLVVVDDDRAFNNSVEHAERVARARNRPPERRGIGTLIDDPPVDFAALARSMGVHGEGPVGDPERLAQALRRALRVVVEEGRPALVDVLT